jgi:hypothetical protein
MRPLVRLLVLVGCAGLVGCVGFFALRSSPHLTEITWLPRWLTVWADNHGVLRNVVAFAAFGLVTFAVSGCRCRTTIVAGLFAMVLEVGQIWLPARFFDWKDIAASWAGLVVAWAVVRLAKQAAKWLRGGDRSSKIGDRNLEIDDRSSVIAVPVRDKNAQKVREPETAVYSR